MPIKDELQELNRHAEEMENDFMVCMSHEEINVKMKKMMDNKCQGSKNRL